LSWVLCSFERKQGIAKWPEDPRETIIISHPSQQIFFLAFRTALLSPYF
jgi:hypothetical protein